MATKFKKVYELTYKTNDQEWHNVLFSTKKRAKDMLERAYYIGAKVRKNKIIINSFIIDRILF